MLSACMVIWDVPPSGNVKDVKEIMSIIIVAEVAIIVSAGWYGRSK